MIHDRQGNPLPGADAAAGALFDQAVEAFSLYRGDPVALIDSAIEASPDCAMIRLFKAWLFATATEPAPNFEARAVLAAAVRLPLSERDASHAAAIAAVLDGDWTEAALRLDRHNAEWPRDFAAIQVGHLIDFYRASARGLRDRILRVLPRWSEATPGRSVLLGMLAFGLEECGDYVRAEETGREAVAIEPFDCWAHHAVAHVMEMQGRGEDGIGWMIAREPWWSGADNLFKVHNWWHRALFHLGLDQSAEALALYDAHVAPGEAATALELVDASAMLWRLMLAGIEFGFRWEPVAAGWRPLTEGGNYPFNDWHAAMAELGAGRPADAERLCRDLAVLDGGETASWARATALPLIRGFAAFLDGDYDGAVDRLLPARTIANSFGGSHAQRDIIDWTLAEAAIRAGRAALAEALANERLAHRPRSPVNRLLAERSRNATTEQSVLLRAEAAA